MRGPALAFAGIGVLLSLSLVVSPDSHAQLAPEATLAGTDHDGTSQHVQILYTSGLFGYFRSPNTQRRDMTSCETTVRDSDDAKLFLDAENYAATNAILVGTGDNFAPEVEAREFWDDATGGDTFSPAAKDRYYWYPPDIAPTGRGSWVLDMDLEQHKKQNEKLTTLLEAGRAMIPMDNVGCFLTRAGYAAVVPGKHDFYFGPDRLRSLARFLASTPKTDGTYVQMLGANMVIKTTWKEDHTPLSDKDNPPKFIAGFPGAGTGTGTESTVKITGLKDHDTVYPWFQGPVVELGAFGKDSILRGDVRNHAPAMDSFQTVFAYLGKLKDKYGSALKEAKADSEFLDKAISVAGILAKYDFKLCEAVDGDPNNIALSDRDATCTKIKEVVNVDGRTLKVRLQLPPEEPKEPARDEEFSTVLPNHNYGLCALSASKPAGKDDTPHCARFSVYVPFFLYPSHVSSGEAAKSKKFYSDPKPYAFLDKGENGLPVPVVIFGAIDPAEASYVGLLNFAWSNENPDFKTETELEDPAVALQQLDDYFEYRYEATHSGQQFQGLKILLAEMSPAKAQELAARVPGFQVVVTEGDADLATGGDEATFSMPPPIAEAWEGKTASHSFVAVPPPYYSPLQRESKTQKTFAIRSIDITLPQNPWAKWSLTSKILDPPAPPNDDKHEDDKDSQSAAKADTPEAVFWARVRAALAGCRAGHMESGTSADDPSKHQSEIEALTLCAIRKKTEADVAMMQERDFYSTTEFDPDPGADANLQRTLDRIVWKGDLMTLLYVPGSTLISVMKESKQFDEDDASQLSLSDEKQRGLVSIGIELDSTTGEYKVNGNPIDPNHLYSVATTDFIGSGDTGYPDFTTAQGVRPRVTPQDYDTTFEDITAVVCRRLVVHPDPQAKGDSGATTSQSASGNPPPESAEAKQQRYCVGPIDRDLYMDELADNPNPTLGAEGARPADARDGATPWATLKDWSIFHRPPNPPSDPKGSPDPKQLASTQAEQRPLWDFNLQNYSFGITTLGHNGSDADIDSKFGGVTTSSIDAHRATTWNTALQSQITRSWNEYQLFLAPGYSYNVQYTGVADTIRKVNQITNIASFDLGMSRLWPNRGPSHRDAVFTAHFETPLRRPIITFPLATSSPGPSGSSIQDQLRFRQDHTYTLMLRAGFRWQNRVSSIEFGPEGGHEFDAIEGFDFFTNGVLTHQCLPNSGVSFSDCAKNASKGSSPTVTKNSTVELLERGRYHSGAYWKINLTVPFNPKISYVLTDTGEWSFVNFGTDTQIDTRFIDTSKHQLKIQVFPSFSLGPEVDLLFYENKQLKSFLRQDTLMMTAQFNFDWFNHRHSLDQIEYEGTPPAKTK